MSDIIKRLRVHPVFGLRPPVHGKLRNEAADALERLTAENAALRKAVTNAANALHGYGMEDQGHAWNTACEILDAAMEQSHDK